MVKGPQPSSRTRTENDGLEARREVDLLEDSLVLWGLRGNEEYYQLQLENNNYSIFVDYDNS